MLHSQQISIQRRLSASQVDSGSLSFGPASPVGTLADYGRPYSRRSSSASSVSSVSSMSSVRQQASRRPSVAPIAEQPLPVRQADLDKLEKISLDMQSTLRELIVEESVQREPLMRQWVEQRLVSAEHKVRSSSTIVWNQPGASGSYFKLNNTGTLGRAEE